jgi:hypothetical protein
MFEWFRNYRQSKGSLAEDMDTVMNDVNNVVKFPEPRAVPPVPPVAPLPEPKIFYRIGATDTNRVAFSMGGMEITMNRVGVQNMIDQLSVFRDQIQDEEPEVNQ